MSLASRVTGRLRREEYTGENRCVPCTVANLAIAAAASAALALGLPAVAPVDAPGALLAGVAAFALACGVIWLRGYLVPGTPTLTRRYFPDRVLRRFDKLDDPVRESADGAPEALDAGDVESLLLDAGVLEPCGDDLCLSPSAREDWRDRVAALRGDGPPAPDPLLAAAADVAPSTIDLRDGPGAFLARTGDASLARWESRAAYVADVAGAAVLADRVRGWEAFGFAQRTQVLGALRLWLEQCPDCDGPVTLDEETVESCCRSIDVVAATCEDCGTRVFESQYDPAAAAA